MASVNLSSVPLCKEDIPSAAFHVFVFALDFTIPLKHLVPVFCACIWPITIQFSWNMEGMKASQLWNCDSFLHELSISSY